MSATPSATVEEIAKAFEALNGVNFQQLVATIRANNELGILMTAEDVANVVADFLPDAKYAADIIAVLIVIVKLRQAGVWRPGEPSDPAMSKAGGPDNPY